MPDLLDQVAGTQQPKGDLLDAVASQSPVAFSQRTAPAQIPGLPSFANPNAGFRYNPQTVMGIAGAVKPLIQPDPNMQAAQMFNMPIVPTEGQPPGVVKTLGEQITPMNMILGAGLPIAATEMVGSTVGKVLLNTILSYFGAQGIQQGYPAIQKALHEPPGGQRRADITQGALDLSQALPAGVMGLVGERVSTSGLKFGDVAAPRLSDIGTPVDRQLRAPARFVAGPEGVKDVYKPQQPDYRQDPAVQQAIKEAGYDIAPTKVEGSPALAQPPQAELPLRSGVAPEDFKRVADTLGVRFDGLQDWGNGKMLWAFTVSDPNNPAHGGTFYLNEDQKPSELAARYKEVVDKFAAVKQQQQSTQGAPNAQAIRSDTGQPNEARLEEEGRTKSSGSDVQQAPQETPGGKVQQVVPEALKGRQFVTQAEKLLRDPKEIGFKGGAQVDAQQLKNRLRNKLGENSTEWTMLKGSGVDSVKGKITTGQFADWVKDNAPRVEVRKFGSGAMTPEQAKYNQLTHDWYDQQGTRFQQLVNSYYDRGFTPEQFKAVIDRDEKGTGIHSDVDLDKFSAKAGEYMEARRKAEAQGHVAEQSHWQSIAPKSEQDMPGYVEIAVVKPLKTKTENAEVPSGMQMPNFGGRTPVEKEMGVQFPSSHNFPPNTLGFVRGYMEKAPNGEKVFHVIEVQSDWAQQQREYQQIVKKNQASGMKRGIADHEDKSDQADPLLFHYERLALKAAIDHARSEGATKIAISDAETAMMTEGHDAVARRGNAYTVDDHVPQVGDYGLRYGNGQMQVYKSKARAEADLKRITETSSPEKLQRMGLYLDTVKPVDIDGHTIAQESGMRLHYDRTLPKIAEELTGQKGEKVSFGSHKMAMRDVSRNAPDSGVERDDLIFRNEQGQPKTDVSARMFNISKPAERLSAAEPMTLTGKLYSGVPIPSSEDFKKMAEPVITKISDMLKRGQITRAMSEKHDAIRGVSSAISNQLGNNIRGGLRRTFGKNLSQAEDALSLVREAQEDKGFLERQLAQAGELKSQPKWQKKWTDAANFALVNWDKLEPISKQYEDYTDRVLSRLSEVDRPIERRAGYVRHLPEEKGNTTGFRHAREYETFFDRIKAGSDPKTLNSVDLLKSTIYDAQRSYIQSQSFINWMHEVKEPVTGKALAIAPKDYEKIPRGEGKQTDIRPPTGYVEKQIGGQHVAILKDYAGLIDRLTNLSIFDRRPLGKLIQGYAGLAKHIQFAIDIVHLARIARRESFAKLGTGHLPIPSWKQGILTLDYSPTELQKMSEEGLVDKEQLPELLRRREINNKLIQGGFNVSRYTDAIRENFLQKIPITGPVQKFIFNTFTRGAEAEVGPITYDVYKKQYPKLTEQQLVSKTVKDLNFLFANMGKQGWSKSASGQDILRLIFAAPQWTESVPRYEAQAIGGTVKGIATFLQGKPQFNIQSRTVGSMILAYVLANQVINYATTGHSTFDNEEGHKLDAYVPLQGKEGYWIAPEAAALETVHRIEQVTSKSETALESAREYFSPKLSVPARAVTVAATGHEYGLTGPVLPKQDQLKAAGENILQLPIITSSLKRGQLIPQVLRSSGLEGDLAQTDRQKMYVLARKWMMQNKVNPNDTGDYPAFRYLDLTDALRRGDINDARKFYEELKSQMGGGQKAETLIQRYYNEYPKRGFTNSKDNESKFVASLTPEQRETYERARQGNEGVTASFYQMLGQPVPAKGEKKPRKKRFSMFE